MAILGRNDQQISELLKDSSRFSEMLSHNLRLHPKTCSRDSAMKLACMYAAFSCSYHSITLCTTLYWRSTKWIVSWYTRQRKKRKDSGDTSSDPAMSPEEIANFKTEYREPALETRTFTAQPVLPNPEKREGQPPKRRRGRPPKLKVQAKQHNGENTLASNQPSSVLLAIHPTPPSLEKALCPSSSMRPIAPRMNPPSSFQAHQFPVPPIIVSNSLEHVDMPNPSINYHSAPGIVRCHLSQKFAFTSLHRNDSIITTCSSTSHICQHWRSESPFESCSNPGTASRPSFNQLGWKLSFYWPFSCSNCTSSPVSFRDYPMAFSSVFCFSKQ